MPVERYPAIPEQLIIALEEDFPERTPDISEALERIRERGGERKVVKHLKEIFRQQNFPDNEGDDV
ncbi:hypothetical protein [Labrys neptuniae]